ncbi:MAG: hypothetical protein COA71_14525 [SAR86 cluster bacterium]|uniref:Uncharacterized protein n=1 Tax=SAR86 cluster bacterium TaxID=2030880 RepID=A0A2A5C6N8_9GAMM|nr:MAG: hypothetical protein COA71_14525 [SAR86 cluster bacterium]
MYFAIIISLEDTFFSNLKPKEVKTLGKTFKEHADKSSDKEIFIISHWPKKRNMLDPLDVGIIKFIKKVIGRDTSDPTGTRGYIIWTDIEANLYQSDKVNIIYKKDFPPDKHIRAFSDPPELKETFDYKKIGISKDMIELY